MNRTVLSKQSFRTNWMLTLQLISFGNNHLLALCKLHGVSSMAEAIMRIGLISWFANFDSCWIFAVVFVFVYFAFIWTDTRLLVLVLDH